MTDAEKMIAYESGTLSGRDSLDLFASLIKTGMVWKLQGSYGRMAVSLIEDDLITAEGVLTQKAHDLITEYESTEED